MIKSARDERKTARYSLRLLILSAVVLLGVTSHYTPFPASSAQSSAMPTIVISQVYGGGGNTGATFTHDFIEIFNPGTTAVSLDGLSLQYASATGTGNLGATSGQLTDLTGTIAPGQYLLVQEAGGTIGAALPTPDIIDPTPINLSASAGKVALVNSTTSLGCNGGSTPCSAAQLASIVDLVGYGTANFFEGAGPTLVASNTTAVSRLLNGCVDTNNNTADFAITSPMPRNRNSPVTTCGSPTPTPTPTPIPTPTPLPTPGTTRIHDIQGATHISLLNGQTVTNVPGIVTATRSNGFYFQDPVPDSDDATSEGIFVFTSSTPTVAVNSAVLVSGRVTEFRPGGSGGTENLTITEIISPTVTVTSSGGVIAPSVIGTGGRIPPSDVIEDDANNSVETSNTFDPAQDGIDFYESLEGMFVQINNAVTVGPTNNFGEIVVLADDGINASVRTTRQGIVVRQTDFNPERIIIDDAIVSNEPQVNVGDSFPGSIVGVIDYSFGNFKFLNTTALPLPLTGGLTQEVTAPNANEDDELSIATFNVENLDPGDLAAKFDRLATLIVNNLKSPDIIALEEVQDNNGATNDTVVDATQTYSRLIAAIEAAGGPTYQFRNVDPVDDQDGGEPGGNIRVGLLFRTDGKLAFVDRPGGTSTTPTTVVAANGTAAQLSFSPGRIDPTNPAFERSRKPLVGEFTFNGRTLFVIANHFVSKGADQPLFGRFQPPARSSEVQREQQAQVVNNFVDEILAKDAGANIVVLGDLNDFEFSTTLDTLKGGVLTNLLETLPQSERYTYVFEGNSQALDHLLVSSSLVGRVSGYDIVHVNAEFADQISDHDPQVARFLLPPPDTDGDGVIDSTDNCPLTANSDQANTDGDSEGDVCDADDDNDGVLDAADNCPLTANPDQADNDVDGIGNPCDPDDDNDGVPDASDNCVLTPNTDQRDTDADGIGDECDATPGNTPGEVEGKGSLSTNPEVRFSFKVEFESRDRRPEGAVGYLDRRVNFALISMRITSLIVSGTHATIRGTGRANDGSPVNFRIDVDDLNRSGTLDKFKIEVSNGYVAEGTVRIGNIKIESAND